MTGFEPHSRVCKQGQECDRRRHVDSAIGGSRLDDVAGIGRRPGVGPVRRRQRRQRRLSGRHVPGARGLGVDLELRRGHSDDPAHGSSGRAWNGTEAEPRLLERGWGCRARKGLVARPRFSGRDPAGDAARRARIRRPWIHERRLHVRRTGPRARGQRPLQDARRRFPADRVGLRALGRAREERDTARLRGDRGRAKRRHLDLPPRSLHDLCLCLASEQGRGHLRQHDRLLLRAGVRAVPGVSPAQIHRVRRSRRACAERRSRMGGTGRRAARSHERGDGRPRRAASADRDAERRRPREEVRADVRRPHGPATHLRAGDRS